MEQIKHFMLPEHTNSLYQEEAISSISLTRDIAAKINEIIDSLNELSKIDLSWKQEQEGTIRKGVLYMKDNLVNSLEDLLDLFKSTGFIDDRIAYHCKVINERLENLLGLVKEGSTSGDAELLDGRTDFTGNVWDNIGAHIRGITELIGLTGIITREQINTQYNNLNYTTAVATGDKVYIEPMVINTETLKYVSILGMYGDYAEDGFDTLCYMLPDNLKPVILTMEREYKGIRITFNLTEASNTIAYGIIKKLTNDALSMLYKNRVTTLNTNNNYNLFEPIKMRYGAHQGYREVAPANSIPAYEEMGKAGFEWAWIAGCRQSKDGTWYVMHNSTVDDTTNGTGAIKEMTDEEINVLQIDVGNNLSNYTSEELKVPTVEDVIKVCHKYGVNICFRLASLYTNATGVEHFKSFIEMIKNNGQQNAIFSGNLKQMEMLKSFTDNWHGQVYVDTSDTQEIYNMIDTFVSKGWTNMSILARYEATTKEVVAYCHKHNYKYCVSDVPAGENVSTVINTLNNMLVDICQTGHIHKNSI